MPKQTQNEIVGAYLGKLRERAGITTRELAEELGMSQTTLWKLENGRMRWTVEYLSQVGGYFALSASRFLKRAGL